jgi:hypothetical protein
MFHRPLKSYAIAAALGAALTANAQPVRQTPTPAPVISPRVQAVALPTGANVQAAGSGFGSLNLGHVSWAHQTQAFGTSHKKDKQSFSVSTKIGLRLECSAADTGRIVSVAASLQQSDSRFNIAIDGVRLSTSPAVFSPSVLCGTTGEHTVEIGVPVTAAPGPISPSLIFQVTLR